MGEIIEKRRRDYSGLDADKASIPAAGKSVNDTFLATDTKILYFWDGVAWIIIPLDVIVAGMIKTDAVETLKIKNLNVTPAKASLGFGRYVPRLTNAIDKTQVDFTHDSAWHVDGLDVSGILPAGATGVVLTLAAKNTGAGTKIGFRHSAGSDESVGYVHEQVAGIWNLAPLILPIDSDRLLDYYSSLTGADGTTRLVQMTILGWFT